VWLSPPVEPNAEEPSVIAAAGTAICRSHFRLEALRFGLCLSNSIFTFQAMD
jgi:hypothetical protein